MQACFHLPTIHSRFMSCQLCSIMVRQTTECQRHCQQRVASIQDLERWKMVAQAEHVVVVKKRRQISRLPRVGGKPRTEQRMCFPALFVASQLTNPCLSQRAFRERKERHVRDLEAKLNALESNAHSLQSDNERLKLALQRARTENEILRATSGHSPSSSRRVSASYPSPGALLPDEDIEEETYNIQALSNGSVVNAADSDHAASRGQARGREVPASQAWDVIQTHPLVKQGLVDVTDVVQRLRGAAKCDGHGPVFEESTIWQAVEESRRSGGDELI